MDRDNRHSLSSQCDGDVVYHQQYNSTFFENDVAVLFLSEPITDINPVKLNPDSKVPL
jgi:hypothetical protein